MYELGLCTFIGAIFRTNSNKQVGMEVCGDHGGVVKFVGKRWCNDEDEYESPSMGR